MDIDLNGDDQPKYRFNWDKLMSDIYNYNTDEDRFHRFVNQMCLDIEAVDEYVKVMPRFNEAEFVINCIKGKLNG